MPIHFPSPACTSSRACQDRICPVARAFSYVKNAGVLADRVTPTSAPGRAVPSRPTFASRRASRVPTELPFLYCPRIDKTLSSRAFRAPPSSRSPSPSFSLGFRCIGISLPPSLSLFLSPLLSLSSLLPRTPTFSFCASHRYATEFSLFPPSLFIFPSFISPFLLQMSVKLYCVGHLPLYCHAGVGPARYCQSRALPAAQVEPCDIILRYAHGERGESCWTAAANSCIILPSWHLTSEHKTPIMSLINNCVYFESGVNLKQGRTAIALQPRRGNLFEFVFRFTPLSVHPWIWFFDCLRQHARCLSHAAFALKKMCSIVW